VPEPAEPDSQGVASERPPIEIVLAKTHRENIEDIGLADIDPAGDSEEFVARDPSFQRALLSDIAILLKAGRPKSA
jgi:hypothetical protein